MNSAVSQLSIEQPRDLESALSLLSSGGLTPIAGATDLYVALNFGTLRERRFVDITKIDELRTITEREDSIVIGGGTSFTQLMKSELVRRQLPILAQAASQVGGVQIQNRGTIGGNVANGSPAGDSLPVLSACDAILMLRSATAERTVPFNSFYTGYRQSVLRPDELIVAVEIPRVEGAQWFRKVGTRAAQAISKIVMAGVRAPHPRIAFGSVAATTVRVPLTERALAAGATIDEAVAVLAGELSPIDDIRSTADYRRQVAGNLLRRFWTSTA